MVKKYLLCENGGWCKHWLEVQHPITFKYGNYELNHTENENLKSIGNSRLSRIVGKNLYAINTMKFVAYEGIRV